ncbi:ABC transporter permease [Pseudonocardia cypriaca]|uniref:Monosaccharide ABC transporter membrane protein (CUT2 family) n=1 Tax=Pseudonocardia cypriaca TaxID=882449 RepID=A0A543FT42_9PSEU|nr:ABC transporter permease [Pseudonocardia cypriaca]TQM36982.1 monosaccharide ABC transporter membrane protein (CUT2 family) [Pseudonocardia cypriaca]
MAGKRLSFQLGMIPAVVAAIVIGALVSDAFLTPGNLLNVLQQSAELAILVIAETLILLTGKFDLSLESVVGFAPMLAAWLVLPSVLGGTEAIPAATGLIVLFGVGAAVGLLNGLMVTRLRLNAFITTLAVLILLRGATLGVADGRTLANLPPAFTYLGSTSFVGLPFTVWIAAVLFAGVHLFLNYHRHGRAIYAVGGNPVAAHAAGIRVSRTVLAVFVVAGVLAALAGLLLTGRLAAVTAGQGQNMIFTVFAAAVIGGISLNGGRGSVLGALLGVLLLGVISNILTLSQISTFWIDAANGAIILAALLIQRATGEKSEET